MSFLPLLPLKMPLLAISKKVENLILTPFTVTFRKRYLDVLDVIWSAWPNLTFGKKIEGSSIYFFE